MCKCDWSAEDGGMYPNGETFVDLICSNCGVKKTFSPDPWMGIDALQDNPPKCLNPNKTEAPSLFDEPTDFDVIDDE